MDVKTFRIFFGRQNISDIFWTSKHFGHFWTSKHLGHFLDDIFGWQWTSGWTRFEKCPNFTPLVGTPHPLLLPCLELACREGEQGPSGVGPPLPLVLKYCRREEVGVVTVTVMSSIGRSLTYAVGRSGFGLGVEGVLCAPCELAPGGGSLPRGTCRTRLME